MLVVVIDTSYTKQSTWNLPYDIIVQTHLYMLLRIVMANAHLKSNTCGRFSVILRPSHTGVMISIMVGYMHLSRCLCTFTYTLYLEYINCT